MKAFRLLILWVMLIFGWGTSNAWKEITTERTRILFEDNEQMRGEAVWKAVTKEYNRLGRLLELDAHRNLPVPTVYVCGSEEVFNRVTGGRIPDWGGACAFPEKGVIVLKPQHAMNLPMHRVIAHELSHVLLGSFSREARIPRWFDEGVAMWVSGEWAFRQRISIAWSLLFGKGPIAFDEIDRVLSFGSVKASQAYDESMAALMFLIKEQGNDIPGQIIHAMSQGITFDQAFEQTTGMTPEVFEQRWRDHARHTFHPVMLFVDDLHLWIVLCLIIPILYLIKRLTTRRVIKRWDAEEELEP